MSRAVRPVSGTVAAAAETSPGAEAAESRLISPALVLATVAHTAVGAVALASTIYTGVQIRRHVQQPAAVNTVPAHKVSTTIA